MKKSTLYLLKLCLITLATIFLFSSCLLLQMLENKNYESIRASAERGDPDGQCQLGELYEMGYMVEQDYKQALYWYTESAKQGYPRALNNLGDLYFSGKGVPKNYNTAHDFYSRSAALNDPDAQVKLGNMYYNGVGVGQNYQRALQFYKQAANNGSDEAQFMMGEFYFDGNIVEQSYVKAAYWWEQSALQDNDKAQYQLGLMYSKGLGVQQSKKQAIYWLEKSSANGNPKAKKMLEIIKPAGPIDPSDNPYDEGYWEKERLLHLYGGKNNSVYLGCLNSDKYNKDSIWNPYGQYGSQYSPDSIWSEYGEYGSQYSEFSPWNKYADTPPIVKDDRGRVYGYFTLNQYNRERANFRIANIIYENYKEIRNNVEVWYEKIFERKDYSR